MLATKDMLLLTVLSLGVLTGVTGTAVPMMGQVFAEDEECEENGDNNCNEEKQKLEQEVKCKIVNDIENKDESDNNSNGENGNGNIVCWNFGQNPQSGDAIVDLDLFPLDPFAPIP